MACFAVTLGVIILSGSINLSAANKDTCDLYGRAGQSLTLPFVYEGLASTHVLRWTHNSTIIFYRQQGRVSVGKSEDISTTGSLLLRNLQFSSAGLYQANLLNPNSTLAKTWTGRLCMLDKVAKPQVTYVCDAKSSAVKLNCNVAQPQGLVFSWTLDGKTLTSETRQTLSISLAQLKGERSFTCSVANKVSTEKSDTVHPTCKSPPPPPVLCFPSKTVITVLAGGAGLILILLTIIIILCCCHRQNKTQMRRRDKGELRMLSLSKREPDSISPEYETMHPNGDSPPPVPKSSPRACYVSVSQPEAQPENKPAQLSTAAEGQQPSPVPKPRTKAPQTPGV
ncbi:T-cell surface antigen CD2-like [Epinephelus fuscoguttatus]|uniref:T-cell surface antigen CD2-like n=1 Tax=Epinephelus fuscoguttatus TaxID=293821 RepID=UPI0020D1CCDD|nr:T-cell surface antigen CD2-like [Epinephelus fuscoguttatus]